MKPVNLIEYFPDILQGVQEFKEITNAENPEFTMVWQFTQDVFNDQFIMDSTANGVRRWEKILGIYPKNDDTLEVRKLRIIALLNRNFPYTHRSLEQMLMAIFGVGNFKIQFIYPDYKLLVEFNSMPYDSKIYDDLMRDVIPANLVLVNYFRFPDTNVKIGVCSLFGEEISVYPYQITNIESEHAKYTVKSTYQQFDFTTIYPTKE